ncbi:cupin domain-containing protein [Gorillibacterium sp. sgz5001074]|uniref:cupin domain-containing protein n=1 Tax=Gorillibacterium sp. sgz5001074 TaxID=3446695 RepID=UPI003F67B056
MLLAKMGNLIGKESAMMTLLHQSEMSKIFMLYLEEGKVKDCGCTTAPEVVFQVLEGQGTIYLNGEPHEVEAGDLLLCPQGANHRLEANRGAEFRLLVVKPLQQ